MTDARAHLEVAGVSQVEILTYVGPVAGAMPALYQGYLYNISRYVAGQPTMPAKDPKVVVEAMEVTHEDAATLMPAGAIEEDC